MSEPEYTRLRDADPVRVGTDGRVRYWSGGVPGIGTRHTERHRTIEDANARAEELRVDLQAGRRIGSRHMTLAQLSGEFVASLDGTAPPGTVRKYRSVLNTWVLPTVGGVRCADSGLRVLTEVLDAAVKAGRSPNMIRSISTTMGALARFGSERGHFGDEAPYGPHLREREAKRRAARNALGPDAYGKNGPVSLSQVPTWADIELLGEAMERVYPARGRAVIIVMAASGLRSTEMLGLQVDDCDLQRRELHVERQIERGADWPKSRRLKDSEPRTTIVWEIALAELEHLVATAEDGWLVPPLRATQRKWPDSFDRLVEQARKASTWPWTLHWTRHHFASWSLAPDTVGGYGLPLESVSRWLGHSDPATTQRSYQHRVVDEADVVRRVTALPPGSRRPS